VWWIRNRNSIFAAATIYTTTIYTTTIYTATYATIYATNRP
jgi:hypothetical protein